MADTVSVIIPTTCERAREPLLRRAIASARAAGATEVLLAVNGNRYAPALVDEVRSDPLLRVIQRDEGNVSAARHAGLLAATGGYFAFLDDDDEFLPGAMTERAALFTPDVDIVVTNGFHHEAGEDRPLVPRAVEEALHADAVGTFIRFNWFASPAALFRRSRVPEHLFDMRAAHYEWTLLFFKLLQAGARIAYHPCLTYRKYEDNPLSVSKSQAYARAYPDFLQQLLTLPHSSKHRDMLQAKYAVALNSLAAMELDAGHRWAAWNAHRSCLRSGGWRYLPFTLRLLLP